MEIIKDQDLQITDNR